MKRIFYWNDACWCKCFPKNAAGLSYLDVGSHDGIFLLRCAQRGGDACGVDIESYWVEDAVENLPNVGGEFCAKDALLLREMYGLEYKMKVGGFSSCGQVVPDLGRFNVVSSFNVIEYMKDQRSCVRSLFNHATDMVMIATDTSEHTEEFNPDGKKVPLRHKTSAKDLQSWSPWPSICWMYGKQFNLPQVFMCAVNPESKIIKLPVGDVDYFGQLAKTDSQRFYESGLKS